MLRMCLMNLLHGAAPQCRLPSTAAGFNPAADNRLDMCFSQQQEAGTLHQLRVSPRKGRGKKLPGGSDSLFFLPISHNEVVPWGISGAECY